VETSKGSIVRRNVLANVIGGSWIVLLNLISIPVQIRLLGAEAYGLVGFVISLQAFLMILDFGLSTTVVREVASDSSSDYRGSRHLIQTSASIYWLIAIVIGVFLVLASNWLVNHWFKLDELSITDAENALKILGIWLLFTWPFVLYTSILTGLQRLDVVNALRVISQTIMQGGGILVLLISKDLSFFLIWLALSSAISTIVAVMITKRLVPSLSLWPRISSAVLGKIWRFSMDINLITILAIVFTQTDRLLIGRLLPIGMLGHYNAAYNISRGVAVIQGFFNSAVLPALASDHKEGELTILRRHYYRYSQTLVYAVTLPSLILIFFANPLLRFWVSGDTAEHASRTLVFLGVGFLLNATMSAAYSLSVAIGNTKIPLTVNLLAVGFYLPLLYISIRDFGIDGAAATWLALNFYYFLTLLPMTQRKIFHLSSFNWLKNSALPFFAIGLLIFSLAKQAYLRQGNPNDLGFLMMIMVAALLYLVFGYMFLERRTRQQIQEVPGLVFASMKSALDRRKLI
jgi:O-antigen/teichoic acid export membrane protein